MTRTSLLVLILSALLLIHYYPDLATLVWFLALSLGSVWLVLTGRKYYLRQRRKRAEIALTAADEREFREYEQEVAALRAKVGAPGAELEDGLALLQQKHRPMLHRRFGPH